MVLGGSARPSLRSLVCITSINTCTFSLQDIQKETTHIHLSLNAGLGRSTKDWKPWMLATRKLKARSTLMWFMVCFGGLKKKEREKGGPLLLVLAYFEMLLWCVCVCKWVSVSESVK